MKYFEEPIIEVCKFVAEDVVTTSGGDIEPTKDQNETGRV